MEEQNVPGGEPPKVRTRKPKTRDPAVDSTHGSQGVAHGQQPPVRKSGRAAQQPPPGVADWDGYGNAGAAQAYPEQYGYGDEQYVDARGYGYGGAQAVAHQGYGYGDASQGYGDEQYVDARGYGYGGAQAVAHQGYGYGDASQGYGYADAGQGYGYADAGQGYGYADAGQGYGYADASQGYGYADVGQQYGYGDASQGYGYGDASQGYGHGGAQGEGAQGYVAPAQHTANEKPKKHRKPKPGAHGVYPGSYEDQHQGDGYGQPVQGSYEGSYGSQHQVDEYGQPVQDGYAYNAAPDPNAHKRDPSKSRKSSRVKSVEKGNHGDGACVDPGNGQHGEPSYGDGTVPAAGENPKGRKKNKESQYEDFPVPAEGTPYAESAVPSRAVNRVPGEHDGDPGSARSRTSQEGSGSSRAKPQRAVGSGRVRAENETRSSRDGLTPSGTPRLNPNPVGSGHSNPEQRSSRIKEKVESVTTPEVMLPANPLKEHMRKMAAQSKPKPAYNDMSMVVFDDPNDRTLVDVNTSKESAPAPAPARSALDEWMKKQSELGGGNNFDQQESLIVMPDDNKEMLETQLFGAPLAKKQSMKLPPVAETVDRPQYQPRGDNTRYQPAAEKPLYQPVQRRPYANTPLLPSTEPQAGADQAGAMQVYNAEGKQIQPNPKCMACVHGIGVPIARIATRIACRQCLTCGCTIL